MAKENPSTTVRPRPANRTAARRPVGVNRRALVEVNKVHWEIPLSRTNLYLISAAVAVIIVGYMLMGTAISSDPTSNQGIWNNANAVTIAPIVLVIGYCIILPFALMKRGTPVQAEKMDSAS